VIQHVHIVRCTRAIVDRESNNASYFEVVERLVGPAGVQPEGALAVQMDFVTLWTRSPIQERCRGRARLALVAPDAVALGEPVVYEVDVTEFVRCRNVTRFGAVPFRGSGHRWFVVESQSQQDWVEVTRVPLEISLEVPVLRADPSPIRRDAPTDCHPKKRRVSRGCPLLVRL
jgi:hypothetical protein